MTTVLYSTRAHVFQVNPETRDSWLQKGDHAVPISINTSDLPRELKLIGTDDDNNEILNATLTPKTQFTKRAQKFGQLQDRDGNVHGLGFNSEADLADFVEAFQKLQYETAERLPPRPNQFSSNTLAHPGHQMRQRQQLQMQMHMQQQQQQPQQPQQQLANNNGMTLNNISSNISNGSSNYGSGSNESAVTAYHRSQSMFGLQTTNTKELSASNHDDDHSPVHQNEQLKYEIERLKLALEQSSKHRVMWENELLKVRTNNVKLTQALQESKAHVEEWEIELTNLREENKELKLRLSAYENSANDQEKLNDHTKIQEYKSYVDEMQEELRRKETEIEDLQRSMEELEFKSNHQQQNGRHLDDSQNAITTVHRKNMEIINAKLAVKIKEMTDVQKEFSQLVDRMHN